MKSNGQINIVAEMPNKVARTKIIKDVQSTVPDHELIMNAARNALAVNSASILRKEYGKNGLTCLWVFDELIDDIIEISVLIANTLVRRNAE